MPEMPITEYDLLISILTTSVLLIGLMILGLIMQAVNYVRTTKVEHRILVNQAKIIASIPRPMTQEEFFHEYSDAGQWGPRNSVG